MTARADACAAKREARLSARARTRGYSCLGGERGGRGGGQEGDRAQPGEYGGVGGRGGGISRCFFLLFFVWRIWGEGDKGALLGSSVFGLGQDLVKGGKMVTAAMTLRAACSGIGKHKITHKHARNDSILVFLADEPDSHFPFSCFCGRASEGDGFVYKVLLFLPSKHIACAIQQKTS